MIVIVPWHRRPVVILALLVCLPPVGIPLMWMRFRWARNTKVGVTIAATVWFAVVARHGNQPGAGRAVMAGADSTRAAPSPNPAADQRPLAPSPVTPILEESVEQANALKRARAAQAHRAEAPNRFIARLEAAGVDGNLVVNVARDEVLPDMLVITVGGSWHYAVKHERLMAAQTLWKLWVRVNGGGNDPDRNWIRLVDLNGNKVGGSGMWGGADINVADD
jgi:hypothetical protein